MTRKHTVEKVTGDVVTKTDEENFTAVLPGESPPESEFETATTPISAAEAGGTDQYADPHIV